MGCAEVCIGQFWRFVDEAGYVTDAEKPDGETQVFDPECNGYRRTKRVVQPWKSMKVIPWLNSAFNTQVYTWLD